MRRAPDTDAFEAFYVETRDRLLLQTLLFTGDLGAAQHAVRDAMVSAWHHWRKVSRLPDPESWVRPIAWSGAGRRHTTRPWHRERGLSGPSLDTLTAFATLTPTQRRVLVLVLTASAPLDQLAREVGLTQQRTETELQSATAAFSLAREVPSVGLRAVVETVAADLTEVRWPRATILTRAGTRRRRSHTLAGALAATAALVVSGVVVSDGGGVHPVLVGLADRTRPSPHPSSTSTSTPPDPVTAADLLDAATVGSALPGAWRTSATNRLFPCQQSTYADPHHESGAVASFAPAAAHQPGLMTAQTAEVSTTTKAATAAYARTVGWYAGCTDGRVQLMNTWRVSGVGQSATVLELRDWRAPARSLVVGVARTGLVTTAAVTRLPAHPGAGVAGITAMLGDAVDGLCGLSAARGCTTGTPTGHPVDPPAEGADPELVGEVDLPPVAHVTQPWIGTTPAAATTNLAATRCDQTSFTGPDVSHAMTRSFVILTKPKLPPEFGVSETVGHFSGSRAAGFVDAVRAKLASCSRRDLGTTVVPVSSRATRKVDLTIWHVRVKISDKSTVRYLMAVMRSGSAVAQLGFVPSGDVDMPGGAFLDLAQRALARLPYLDRSH